MKKVDMKRLEFYFMQAWANMKEAQTIIEAEHDKVFKKRIVFKGHR